MSEMDNYEGAMRAQRSVQERASLGIDNQASLGDVLANKPRLIECIDRLDGMRERIVQASNSMSQTSDALGFNAEPVDGRSGGARPQAEGMLNMLESAIDDLFPAVGRLEDELRRLQRIVQ